MSVPLKGRECCVLERDDARRVKLIFKEREKKCFTV